MLRKTTLITLLTLSTVSLSGCSSMWSGIGSFSEYMAEKTRWSSKPALRGAKTVTTTKSVDTETYQEATYQAATSDMTSSDYGVEIYDASSSDTVYTNTAYSDTGYTDSYSETLTTSSDAFMSDSTVSGATASGAPLFDADGNYIDTSPIPCPEDTYLTADNTCMYLEQEDYASEFTQ